MPGSGAVDIAMERGEVQGKIGPTWTSLNSGATANWVRDKIVTPIVQFGLTKAPNVPDVPLGLDLAKTPEDRQALEVLCAPSATGYPSFMGPGVPKERVEAIRAAYTADAEGPGIHRGGAQGGLDHRSDRRRRDHRHRARHLCAAGGGGRARARSDTGAVTMVRHETAGVLI